MKISINTIAKLEASSIADAIEKIAAEHDTIASGIIGPTFACSGPGSGWQRNYDETDYARRAMDDDEGGATSYIDSANGRRATLDKQGEVVWTEESVVTIELPSVEGALDYPAETAILLATAADYDTDEEEIEELREKLAKPYVIDGAGGKEYAATLEEAASMAEDWYDFLLDDGRLDKMPACDLDSSSLVALQRSIDEWQERIAKAMGKTDFAGHGRYFVSAADQAGMDLSVDIRD